MATVGRKRHVVSEKLRKARLGLLATFLETMVPQSQHNQAQFATECGTPACALGWATAIPKFAARGLTLQQIEEDGETYYVVTYKVGRRTYEDMEAGHKFFGLSYDDCSLLFGSTQTTVKEKAKQIRLIAGIN